MFCQYQYKLLPWAHSVSASVVLAIAKHVTVPQNEIQRLWGVASLLEGESQGLCLVQLGNTACS